VFNQIKGGLYAELAARVHWLGGFDELTTMASALSVA
jgi:hypothetical protein